MQAHSQPPTIHDIAGRCGVTATVVSAALRGKRGSVRYSEATRKRILSTARNLGYRPNRIARAMVSSTLPLVALALRMDSFDATVSINFYLHDLLPATSLALHERGLEMLLVPYHDAEDQVDRIRQLHEERFAGGVIANFIPGTEDRVIQAFRDMNIAFVMLGNIADETVPSVHVDGSAIDQTLDRLARQRGCGTFVKVHAYRSPAGEHVVECRSPGSDLADLRESEIDFAAADTLYAAMGERTAGYLLDERRVSSARVVVVEDDRMRVQVRPALLVRSRNGERAAIAAELMAEWLQGGQAPEPGRRIVRIADADIRVLEAEREKP